MVIAYGRLELDTKEKKAIRKAFLGKIVGDDKDLREINKIRILDYERDCKQIKRINKYRGVMNYYLKLCKGFLIIYRENAEPFMKYNAMTKEFSYIFGDDKGFFEYN